MIVWFITTQHSAEDSDSDLIAAAAVGVAAEPEPRRRNDRIIPAAHRGTVRGHLCACGRLPKQTNRRTFIHTRPGRIKLFVLTA